ncbi:MAG: PHP domain-containing protein [Christensenellaceae bacterium]|jgi:putative hydrolase|nr:PHP domain-containing protein [Christensenellaceae bacterium]
MIIADYHTHTRYSHGTGTPEDNVKAAIDRGLSRIAISEHAPAHMLFGVHGGHLRALRKEVDRLAQKYAAQIEVLMGLECNLTAYGRADLPSNADLAPFDVLLLAYHKGVFPLDGFCLARTAEAFLHTQPDPVRTANALLAAAEAYHIHMFAHPGLYVRADIPTLARGAKELGVLLEINSARVTMSQEELRATAALGAAFVIGSDAHSPARVGDFELALSTAARAGVLEHVVNYKAG